MESYRALRDDAEVERDMDALRAGNVLAIYRLQRNPKIVRFLEEPEVQAILPKLRPTVLAREIQAFEQDRGRIPR